MFQKEIKVVVVKPQGLAEVQIIKNDLTALQKIVGGYLEVVPLTLAGTLSKYQLIINEDGKMLNLPPNFKYGMSDFIVGTAIIVGYDNEGNFTGIEERDIPSVVNLINSFPRYMSLSDSQEEILKDLIFCKR